MCIITSAALSRKGSVSHMVHKEEQHKKIEGVNVWSHPNPSCLSCNPESAGYTLRGVDRKSHQTP